MARPARRGPSALRLENLESRTLLSGDLSGPAPAIRPDPAASQAQSFKPDDSSFGLQWGLKSGSGVDIDATQAWRRTTGSASIIVAVLDTGIDLSNPEFAGRIWTNPDPSGRDGYVGDVHGWNFVANNANVQDDDGHGTHVAGILAATGGYGLGVAGVDWNARIMPLKVLDSQGSGSNAAIVAAINFAVQQGARVINASWGGGEYSQAVADAIHAAGDRGVVFVTAAGNSGTDNDVTPFYPASYRLPNEIVVAAVNEAGLLPSFSNSGPRTVDLAAPGTNILSTIPGGDYAFMSGTSMATPYVSGVVSLVAGLHPTFNARQLVQQVLTTTKPLPGLAGRTVTGGIVDAAQAVGVSHPGARGISGSHATSFSHATPHTANTHPAVLGGTGRRGNLAHGIFRTRTRSELGKTGASADEVSWLPRRAVLQVRPASHVRAG